MLERLRREAAVQWRGMARKLSHCGFEYTLVETDGGGRLAMRRAKRITGYVADNCFLLTETIESTEEVSVYGRNERYEFAITRSGNRPWTVVWQGPAGGEDTPVGSAHAYLIGMLCLPWSISAAPLDELVSDRRFSVRAVRRRSDDCVELEFAIAPADTGDNSLQGLSGGVLVLDPQRCWAIAQYHARYAQRMATSATLTYTRPGPPELRQVRFALRTRPKRTSDFEINVARYDWALDPEPEITLSAFGLPEYQDPADRRWLGLVNLGMILVVAGFMLRRHRQRRNAVG
jgi:hypothetical protein